MEIRYRSRRGEIWRWYWNRWARGLWRVHLLVIVAAFVGAILASLTNHGAASVGRVLANAIPFSAAAIAFMIFYPQLRFKAEERSLSLSAEGVATVIGKQSAIFPWNEISSVEEDGEFVILSNFKNCAFVVPQRAFANPDERQEFLAFVRTAKADAAEAEA
jgi:hypothetical protein